MVMRVLLIEAKKALKKLFWEAGRKVIHISGAEMFCNTLNSDNMEDG